MASSNVAVDSNTLALESSGWVLVKGLESFDSAKDYLRSIGRLIPQYDGNLWADVHPEDGYAALPLSGGTADIGPHTDGIALECPPELLALYCVEPATCGGGCTNIGDGLDIVQALSDDEQRLCREKRFEFSTKGDFRNELGHRAKHPILEKCSGSAGKMMINYSHNYFCLGDLNPVHGRSRARHRYSGVRRIVEKIYRRFSAVQQKILIPRHGLLIWDNRRMLHSRDSFSDPNRHLIRFWVS